MFPWVPDFMKRVPVILAEFESVVLEQGRTDILKTAYNTEYTRLDPQWKTHNIIGYGYKTSDLFPKTYEIVRQIPNLFNCNISRLPAHTNISPHVGENSAYIRFHLGLKVPGSLPEVGMIAGGQKRSWQKGKLLAFCDVQEHAAINQSDQDRFLLIFDIMPQRYAWYTKQFSAFMIAASLYLVLLPGNQEHYNRPGFNLRTFRGQLISFIAMPLLPLFYIYFRYICKKAPRVYERIRNYGFAFYF